MKRYTQTQKLTIAGICIALYIAVMMCTQTFAFGQYQVRIATAMYGLSAIFPFLIVPFGIANVISNTIMGGLGPLDMIGGGIVGIVTSSVIVLAKKYGCGNWCILFAITLIPGLGAAAEDERLGVGHILDDLVRLRVAHDGAARHADRDVLAVLAGAALVTALEKSFAVNIAAERK